jgi:hypothetical protein
MSVMTAVIYGNIFDGQHRIGLFAGKNCQSAYISSTYKCGMTNDQTNCETTTRIYDLLTISAAILMSRASLTLSSFTPITGT